MGYRYALLLLSLKVKARMFEVEKIHTSMGDNVVVNPVVDLLANADEPGPSSDEEADDDDDSLMMDVPLVGHAGELPLPKLEAPPEGMSWKESAILECMDLALKSHDDDHPLTNFVWKSPLENEEEYIADSIKDWIPKPLSLPIWAVDPCLATLLAHKDSIEQESRERATSSTKGAC